jgi:hypothetical protein
MHKEIQVKTKNKNKHKPNSAWVANNSVADLRHDHGKLDFD